ncbi:MAG TPA: transcription antitermination factor NusB [Acidimicrobiales bacterium]|nr:transcription antitermination factor NusB [Acidimicrobiales bacterium]
MTASTPRPSGPSIRRQGAGSTDQNARAVAAQALLRIDEGAYANLVVPELLDACDLSARDRAFVTELVYGSTRMRRACDWLVDRFTDRPLDPDVRAVLRLGAYQLAFLQTPPHAAVSATVSAAPPRARGFVNAVLRKVAGALPPRWPDPATKLSYPDWIVRRLAADLGVDAAAEALEQMNVAPTVTERDDGYVQDEASQQVAAYVGASAGERVADLCAAPGGKATAMAAAFVAASDLLGFRVGLVQQNVRRLRLDTVAVVQADGRRPPYRPGSFDRVLLDAPCSGLGVLRRRPDARWRIEADDIDRLVVLQRQLLDAAVDLVRPGGVLVYSVCTLTLAESLGIDEWLADAHPTLAPLPPPVAPWEPLGRGARLLPQAAGTDGMYVLGLRKP